LPELLSRWSSRYGGIRRLDQPTDYVYVDEDRSVRERLQTEDEYLSEVFLPGDD